MNKGRVIPPSCQLIYVCTPFQMFLKMQPLASISNLEIHPETLGAQITPDPWDSRVPAHPNFCNFHGHPFKLYTYFDDVFPEAM